MTRRVALPAVLAAFLLLAGGAQPASAATCSDYANQADAQRAADTRDADGDGIYCEALPCPCLKPRGGGGDRGPSRPPAAASHLLERTDNAGGRRRHDQGAR